MTVEQLFDAWRRADVVQYNLTTVEGWTFRGALGCGQA